MTEFETPPGPRRRYFEAELRRSARTSAIIRASPIARTRCSRVVSVSHRARKGSRSSLTLKAMSSSAVSPIAWATLVLERVRLP